MAEQQSNEVYVAYLLQQAEGMTQSWGENRRAALQRLILKIWARMVTFYTRKNLDAEGIKTAVLTRTQLADALQNAHFGRCWQHKQWEIFVQVATAYLDE